MKQTMEINIQAVHFDATEKLKEFATKKVEVQMKLVKPQTALNKEVSLSVAIPGGTQYVEKTCDTFEESIDLCVDAMRVKLTKMKEKTRNH